MKTILALLLVAALAATGCMNPTSADGRGNFVSTFGPLVAEVAQARIAKEMLDGHPEREASLLAIAAALEAITTDATGTEITEAAIRLFVAKGSESWQLTAPERELITLGLIAAKDAALAGNGGAALYIGDAQVGPWIQAVRRGIVAGIAAHHAQ